MTTEAPQALRADACPEPEQLAAYIDGTLTPDERTQMERHLAECPECRDVVAESVAALDELGGLPARKRPSMRAWAGVGVVLAAAAAIVIAVRLQRPTLPGDVPELARLAQAIGAERVIEPRLTGGFGYGPRP